MATTFDRARRRKAYQRLTRVVAAQSQRELLPLDDATRRLRPFQRHYAGLQTIPIRQIVGTDGRGRDFDREFLPRRPDIGDRWRRLEAAYPEGGFPPIVVYQLGDAYFVVDGHHRVAITRQRGGEMIDAEVTELHARWHLPADADVVELIHAEQERIFMDESGLEGAYPKAHIRFSRPSGYIELLENTQIHGYHLMLKAGHVLERAEMARDWYETIYLPSVEALRAGGTEEACADATDADLFLWAYQRRRELFPECGCPPLEHVPLGELAGDAGKRRGLRRLLGGAAPAG
jgi:hypothetical protein